MKKATLIFVLFSIARLGYAQVPGEWVWRSGSSEINYPGHMGIRGKESLGNCPPALYEAIEWTDQDGNFWLFGGMGVSQLGFENILWKYNILTNKWCWVSGNINSKNPVYGIRGVPSPNNTPGGRAESYSWIDREGNLWLFGGVGAPRDDGNAYNDLWKYCISTNMWTWMKGDTGINYNGNYGKKGIERSFNNPPKRDEVGIAWTDNLAGDLWLLDYNGCLWKYRIQTNNWIWMKGSNTGGGGPTYGTKGIPSPNNTPGRTFQSFTRWKDSSGNFWYLETSWAFLKILWKYEPTNNMWSWMDGDTTTFHFSNYKEKCVVETDPIPRTEARACWIDDCDNLWLMGGWTYNQKNITLNDLIYFDSHNLNWVWVSNDTVETPRSNYGTKGVSSPTNMPSSRSGAMPFKDKLGNLWLFGGLCDYCDHQADRKFADLWMYTPDTNCTNCHKKKIKTEIIGTNNEFNVFPNPSLGEFNFSGLDKESVVEIYDVRGCLILEAQTTNETLAIDLTANATGMYFYKAIDKNFEVHRGKIILQ